MEIIIGNHYKFNYPKEFVTLPEYSKRRGLTVKVIRELIDKEEYDFEGEKMYKVEFSDGWQGDACEGELV